MAAPGPVEHHRSGTCEKIAKESGKALVHGCDLHDVLAGQKTMSRSRSYFEQHFDAETYLKAFYPVLSKGTWIETWMKYLHEEFRDGSHSGSRLLDVGTGPSIITVISASSKYTGIYLSDYLHGCRAELQKWLKKDPSAHDWTTFIDFVAQLEQIKTDEVEKRVRSAVKDTLHCDILDNNVVVNPGDPFDCITTSLCLEGACTDYHSFKDSVRKIAALLREGGYFIGLICIGDEWYKVGSTTFSALCLTIEEVKEAFHEAGLDIEKSFQYTFSEEELASFKDIAYAKGVCLITAKKV